MAEWQSNVLAVLAKGIEDGAELVDFMSPYSDTVEEQFGNSWGAKPSVAGSALSDEDKARLWQRSIVREHLVPMLQKGQDGASKVLQVARLIVQKNLDKPEDVPEPIAMALESVAEVGLFLIALGSPVVGELGSGIEHVTSVMSGAAGSKLLIKRAVIQSAWWRAQEAEVRSFDLATRTMLPEMSALKERLRANDWTALDDVIAKLPLWLDRMRPGAVQEVQLLVPQKARQRLGEMQANKAEAEAFKDFSNMLETGAATVHCLKDELSKLAKQARNLEKQLLEESLHKTVTGALAALGEDCICLCECCVVVAVSQNWSSAWTKQDCTIASEFACIVLGEFLSLPWKDVNHVTREKLTDFAKLCAEKTVKWTSHEKPLCDSLKSLLNNAPALIDDDFKSFHAALAAFEKPLKSIGNSDLEKKLSVFMKFAEMFKAAMRVKQLKDTLKEAGLAKTTLPWIAENEKDCVDFLARHSECQSADERTGCAGLEKMHAFGISVHEKLVGIVRDACVDNTKLHIQKLKPIAGGLQDGSWKAKLKQDATWTNVLQAGKGLMQDPGPVLQKNFKQAWKDLCCRITCCAS
eukprot:6490622-Amphidinium_carterae.3